MITDFHTHAFPEALAERAIRTLEAETADVKARLDGRISSPEYILFGTDSPWQDHTEALARFRALGLGPRLEEMILSENAGRLLDA